MKSIVFSLGLALSVAAGPVMAKEQPNPVQQHNSNAVWFENWIGLTNASMTIAMPSGEVVKLFAPSGTPVFKLEGNKIADGIYRYELSAATKQTAKILNKVDNGRGDAARDSAAVPYRTNGQFTVYRGVIITPEDIKEE